MLRQTNHLICGAVDALISGNILRIPAFGLIPARHDNHETNVRMLTFSVNDCLGRKGIKADGASGIENGNPTVLVEVVDAVTKSLLNLLGQAFRDAPMSCKATAFFSHTANPHYMSYYAKRRDAQHTPALS